LDKQLFEYYQKYLERKELYIGFGYDIDRERCFVLEQAKPLYGRILEAGTGKGHFAIALAKEGHSFVAFDISPEELHFARLNLAYFGLDKCADFRIEDAEHTSFSDRSFDIVFSVNTLHHLRNPYKVIDELTRILSQKGKLVLSDFTEEGFAVIGKIHALEGRTHEVNKITILEIKSHLEQKGFSIKTTNSVHQHVLIAEKELI